MDTTMDLVDRVRARVDDEGISEPAAVRGTLREEITATLNSANASTDVDGDAKVIYLVTGVNGAGKTTSIAKLAHAAKSEGKSVLLAAADTFRAGAIEQIQIWGGRLDIDVIAHQAGGDPGAVAYDAIKAAKSRNVDVLFIDTAGRLQTSHNLMAELEKVGRVVEREAGDYEQRGILVLDATTGQNGLVQTKSFGAAVRCDGVVLTKLDSTAKGGIVLAIAGDLKLPVWYIGTGETLEDISTFDPEAFARTLVPDAAPEA
jgi:fused signal recognition particle receptor